MYKADLGQPEFEDFYLPFGGRIRSDNRWVVLSKFMPWDAIEEKYAQKFSRTRMGAPAKPARVAIGALIIKERGNFSDDEVALQIQENPYLQYFLGYAEYCDKKPFNPTMMVHFRKRFSLEELNEINEMLNEKYREWLKAHQPETADDETQDDDDDPPNSGQLILDATCAPADITYPTDLKLLNDAREKSEQIIDILHAPLKGSMEKVRTYRQNARRDFLRVAKKKRLRKKELHKGIGKQLRYLRRNLKHIKTLVKYSNLSLLSKDLYNKLLVIHEVYRQQNIMYRKKTNKIEHRIVNLSQPHVRPIVRGKVGAQTEFGAKLTISVTNSFVFLERLSWENYNESVDFISQVESYKEKYGYYPESVHADKIFRTRVNLNFCKQNEIRFTGKPLGRPRKEEKISKQEKLAAKRQQQFDEGLRNTVEGKFGQAKRRFGLGRIMAKQAGTSETEIGICLIVLNLEKCLKDIFLSIFQYAYYSLKAVIETINSCCLNSPGFRCQFIWIK